MANSRYELIAAEIRTETAFDLDQTAELSGMHPEMILEFARAELIHISAGDPDSAPCFDQFAIARLRQIEHFRRHEKLNLRTVRYIVHLLDRLEAADSELRTLRERIR
ncbi:MAG: hypothetical protein ACI9R3_006036 [Verrucomicrobiales bacterium]|jgi:hypothetical protein